MKNVLIVAKYTFKEFIQGKIAIAVGSLALVLFIATYVATQLTYSTVNRVILDIGLGLVVLSAISMAIFHGVNLISAELENKTLYMVLSRPISRFEFFLGKIVALTSIMFVSILVLSIQTIALFKFNGGEIVPLLGFVIVFSFLEALILMCVTVLFSLLTNRYLTIFYSVIIYIIGHSLDGAIQTRLAEKIPLLKNVIAGIGYVVPSLYKLNFKDFVLYNATIDSNILLSSFGYALCYIVALLALCLLVFEKKELT